MTGRRKSVEAPVKSIVHLTHPPFEFASVICAGDISIKPTRESISHPVDISMAAIILFYCPANNEMNVTSTATRNRERGASMRASIFLHQRVDGTESFCSGALINANSFLSLSKDLRVYSAMYFADLSNY